MKSFEWDQLASQLPPGAWAGQAKYFETCSSTQDEAEAWAQQGGGHGDLVLAEEQLRGRGRWGKKWESSSGSSLLVSVILKPQAQPDLSSLSLALGLGLAEGLDEFGAEARLKWPNDLYTQGRKLAGLLVEQKQDSVVFGFGLNVSALPKDSQLQVSAIALMDILNREVEREALLAALLKRLKERYDDWVAHGFGSMKDHWLKRALWLGEEVQAGEQAGIYEGLENNGALRLKIDGRIHLIQSGDLTSLRSTA